MQHKQFIELDKFLKVSPNHAVTLTDVDFGTNYETNITHNQICQKFGDLGKLLNNLVAKGITSVHVTPRKKNGSQSGNPNNPNYMNIPTFPKFTFKMQPKEPMQPSLTHVQDTLSLQGLNGGTDSVDMIKYKAFDYARVLKEYEEIKHKYSKAKKKVANLERQVIDYEHNTQSKKGLNGVVETITSSPEMLTTLAGIAEKFLNRPATPSLPTGLSDIKQQFMNADDLVLKELARIAPHLNNESFLNELELLIAKHNNQ